jgi:hypothetical protein
MRYMPEDTEPTAQLTPEEAAEVRQDRELIKKSRESIEDGRRYFADSFDRLSESQNLLRRVG